LPRQIRHLRNRTAPIANEVHETVSKSLNVPEGPAEGRPQQDEKKGGGVEDVKEREGRSRENRQRSLTKEGVNVGVFES